MYRERARENIGRPALRRRRDKANRAGGVVLLRLRGSGEGEREEEGAKDAGQRTGFHGASRCAKFPPALWAASPPNAATLALIKDDVPHRHELVWFESLGGWPQ